jgi:hypothetical protein
MARQLIRAFLLFIVFCVLVYFAYSSGLLFRIEYGRGPSSPADLRKVSVGMTKDEVVASGPPQGERWHDQG